MFRIAPRSGCLSRNTRLLTLALRACRIPLSRPSRARELKLRFRGFRGRGAWSRPSRARELKRFENRAGSKNKMSRPSWARELKLRRRAPSVAGRRVAPLVGA